MTTALLAAPLALLLSAAPAAPAAAPPAAGSAAPRSEAVQAARAPVGPLARLLDPVSAWRGARFGMTVPEVLAAFPGEARRLEPEERLADGKVLAVGIEAWPLDGLSYRVRFLFDGGRLALVSLKSLPARPATGTDYELLKARLAAEAGRPASDLKEDLTVDFREARFVAGGTALDLKFLQGIVVLLYHPAGG